MPFDKLKKRTNQTKIKYNEIKIREGISGGREDETQR